MISRSFLPGLLIHFREARKTRLLMRTILRLALLISIGLGLIAPEIEAQDDFEIAYDLFIRDSCLTTWLNLAPLITSKSVQRLRDGVDLAIECRATLEIPRRFWGDPSRGHL